MIFDNQKKKKTFYEQQKKVANCLCQMSWDSMQKAASEKQPSDVVSVDGSWDHWREGNECQVVFVNKRSDKVISVQQVTKGYGNETVNFSWASGNMESEANRHSLPKLKQIKIKGYTHDDNNKTRKIFWDNLSELKEHLDSVHVKKSHESNFAKFNIN